MELGTRYQCTNTAKLYRLYRFKNENTAILIDENNIDSKISVNVNELKDSYIKINPHILMNIMITESDLIKPSFGDVYICMHLLNKTFDLYKPDLLVRQDVYRHNVEQSNDCVIHGICTAKNQYTGDDYIKGLIAFTSITYKKSIVLYGDDTVDSIIRIINPSIMKVINSKLKYIKDSIDNYTKNLGFKIYGYFDNLKDLLISTDFISFYRSLFNIIQVFWTIDLGPESHDENNNIILNYKQHALIEQKLRKHIVIKSIIEYGHDIDITKQIVVPHIMISDNTEKIYIITFKELSSFQVDDDIARAMKIK